MFWTRTTTPTQTKYWRSRQKKRLFYVLILVGFVLTYGLPPLVILLWGDQPSSATLLHFSFIPGPLLIIYVAVMVSVVNFHLLAARVRGKRFEISSTPDGDVVVIDR
jgi:hypothetical protein